MGSATPDELFGPLSPIEREHTPDLIYYSGDTSLLKDTLRVAVVGARDSTPEGERRAKKLAALLVARGIVVVSGLAKGIDAAAHAAAIESGGRTIAVLGTPLNRAYPAQNSELQALIARDHLVLTQFPDGTATQKFHFPQRNRLMACLCHASVIVEAAESSGTVSQGWEALRLGRELFIPKSLFDSGRKWVLDMVHYGAHVLVDFDELAKSLPLPGEDRLANVPF